MIDKYAENLFTVLEDVLFERCSGIGLGWGDSIVVPFLFYWIVKRAWNEILSNPFSILSIL